MAYLALYRKYRPQTFEEIVGQEAVVKALRNQVQNGRVGHAYLFCGTHGTGKTTLARVFGRAVNCQHPVNGSPCGECEFCRNSQANLDLIEIDAASNNGVDEIRELREEVAYAPVAGRYKVYIIDEAHMLSAAAFNALLKTLEEPPEHVIFILATTEPQKILTTILSRCQRYDFGRLTVEQIHGQLKAICEKEGMEVEDEALLYMASHVDGSSRDALSLLDQCRAYFVDEPITLEKVLDVLGAVDAGTLSEMTGALTEGNPAALLMAVDRIFQLGRDPQQLVASLASYLRGVLLYRVMGDDAASYISEGSATLQSMKEQAGKVTPAQLTFCIQELSKLNNSIKFSSDRRILLETGLVAIAAGRSGNGGNVAALEAKIDRLEAKVNGLGNGVAVFQAPPPADVRFSMEMPQMQAAPVPQAAPAPQAAPVPQAAPAPQTRPVQPTMQTPQTAPAPNSPAPQPSATAGAGSTWTGIMMEFTQSNPSYSGFKACVLEQGEEKDMLVLRAPNEFTGKLLSNTMHFLEEFIEQKTGQKMTVTLGPVMKQEPKKSMQEMLGQMGSGIEFK